MLVNAKILSYKKEQEEQLNSILSYWMQYAVDQDHGGFYGKIDHDNQVVAGAAKGSVLNSRILWTFSAAFRLTKHKEHLIIAGRAYGYIKKHFIDEQYGGVYWTVSQKGEPLDTKKQIYALAFCLYALSEYYLATGNDEAKETALAMYNTIEQYSHDGINKGYTEAFARDWRQLTDLRLSEKDANESKSMNTHLHVLEAYTNLYRIWPNAGLKNNIGEILHLFLNRIIDSQTGHLELFFDDVWNRKSATASFGHDIEAAWLLLEAAEVIEEPELINSIKEKSIVLAKAALEGLDSDGGLWYEYEHHRLVREKHWWVQAEAMIGFLSAWQLSSDEIYLEHSINAWQFVKRFLLHPKGEWIWGIKQDGSPMLTEDKVGLWKCPYHNARACMEIIRRLK